MQRILALLIALLPFHLLADDEAGTERPAFYLEDGDRVVLLGGTIIEREQVYGEWELMLTCLYADADFTVRNLGWSGDTVWAESRGIFDPPEVGYQRMIDQIRDLNPTVVILAYGHNEAWAGEAGLEAFITQYEKLIDDIQAATEAETRYLILLPHPHINVGGELPQPTEYNNLLPIYRTAIEDLAARRQAPWIDPLAPMWSEVAISNLVIAQSLSDDGVQPNPTCYRLTAMSGLQMQFAEISSLPHSHTPSITVENGQLGLEFFDQSRSGAPPGETGFEIQLLRWNLIPPNVLVSVEDLPQRQFSLLIDGQPIVTQSAKEWENPPIITNDPDQLQREALRQAIVHKNELYFHRWRPQNVTYLFGFRAHEQGNNAVEIPQFDPLIEEQEALIRELKHPVEHVWELVPAE